MILIQFFKEEVAGFILIFLDHMALLGSNIEEALASKSFYLPNLFMII